MKSSENKSIVLSSGVLYFNGHPLATDIQELTLESEEEIADELIIKRPSSYEATFTCSNMERNGILSLLHGRRVTNNWLRMHGGIMTRKRSLKKCQ